MLEIAMFPHRNLSKQRQAIVRMYVPHLTPSGSGQFGLLVGIQFCRLQWLNTPTLIAVSFLW